MVNNKTGSFKRLPLWKIFLLSAIAPFSLVKTFKPRVELIKYSDPANTVQMISEPWNLSRGDNEAK